MTARLAAHPMLAANAASLAGGLAGGPAWSLALLASVYLFAALSRRFL